MCVKNGPRASITEFCLHDRQSMTSGSVLLTLQGTAIAIATEL